MYSAYKSQTTVKFLISCTPSGAISFVSDACTGLMSDREIVIKSGYLSCVKLSFEETEERLVVLADRGFNIQDVLLQFNVKITIPPFLRGKSLFLENENRVTKTVASSRIHVERVIGRLKMFRILKHTVPSDIFDLMDHVIVICCGIVNMHKPIIPNK